MSQEMSDKKNPRKNRKSFKAKNKKSSFSFCSNSQGVATSLGRKVMLPTESPTELTPAEKKVIENSYTFGETFDVSLSQERPGPNATEEELLADTILNGRGRLFWNNGYFCLDLTKN